MRRLAHWTHGRCVTKTTFSTLRGESQLMTAFSSAKRKQEMKRLAGQVLLQREGDETQETHA